MICIAGAASTVGKETCRLLRKGNIQFRAGIHNRTFPSLHDLTTDVVHIDYLEKQSMRTAVAGADVVLFIPPASPKMPEMLKNLIGAASQARVKCIVKISAYRGNEKVLSPLGSWHNEADKVLQASSLPYVLLHCLPFMQNFFFVAETMIKKYRTISLPCGDAKVSHIDARDIASVACKILKSPELHVDKHYVLTGGEALSYAKIADIFSDEIGTKITYRDIEAHEASKILRRAGLAEQLIEAKLISFELEKKNLRSVVSSHVNDLTGKKPTAFREFVKNFISIFE